MAEVYKGREMPDPSWIQVREYVCPGCGTQLEVEAVPRGCPPDFDFLPDLDTFYEDWLGRPVARQGRVHRPHTRRHRRWLPPPYTKPAPGAGGSSPGSSTASVSDGEFRFQRCSDCGTWRHVPREMCAVVWLVRLGLGALDRPGARSSAGPSPSEPCTRTSCPTFRTLPPSWRPRRVSGCSPRSMDCRTRGPGDRPAGGGRVRRRDQRCHVCRSSGRRRLARGSCTPCRSSPWSFPPRSATRSRAVIAVITIDRPEAMNSLTKDMLGGARPDVRRLRRGRRPLGRHPHRGRGPCVLHGHGPQGGHSAAHLR